MSIIGFSKIAYPDNKSHIYNPLWIYRAKFIIRAFFYYKEFNLMVANIPDKFLSLSINKDSRFIEKAFRPYITAKSSSLSRVNMVISHYKFLEENVDFSLIEDIFRGNGVKIDSVLNDDGEYSIFLSNDSRYNKEGDLTIKLTSPEGFTFYSISFVICEYDKKISLLIGGIQGPESDPENKNKIKNLTKTLNGIRPKDLMVHMVRILASELNVANILAVSNKSHIYKARRYIGDNHNVAFDYDLHWLSQSGVICDNDDFFLLPVKYLRKDINEIPRSKRAMYRRRYDWLDEVEIKINNIFKRNN